MFAKSFSYNILLIVALFFLPGCKKSDSPSSQPGDNSFTWTYIGTKYTGKENEASVYSLGPYLVVAGTDRNALSINRKVSFTLTSFIKGTYNIGSSNSNKFYYVDDSGAELFGKSGTVTITYSSNNFLSENFSCTLSGPSTTANLISGSYTNVSVKP